MECVSLKNLSFLKIHEEGLFKCEIFEDLPPILKEEFHDKKRCCFFSYGKTFSSEKILDDDDDDDDDESSLYDLVRWFVNDMCLEAANNGHLKCFMFSMENGIARTCWKLKNEQNDDINGLEVVVNTPTKECKYVGHIWYVVFEKGHVDFVKYAMSLGFRFEPDHFVSAAENGQLDILTCPELTNGLELPFKSIITSAANFGHMNIIEYCFNHWKDQINPFISKAVTGALKWKQTNVLNFLFTHARDHFSESVWINTAFFRGNEEFVMNFVLENNFVMTVEFWMKAAKREHLNLLKIAIERKIPLDERVWVEAATHGRVSCLKLAVDSKIHLGKNVWIAATTRKKYLWSFRLLYSLFYGRRHKKAVK